MRRSVVMLRFFAPLLVLIIVARPLQAQIEIGGGNIDVLFEGTEPNVRPPLVLDWIKTAAHAVTDYFGRFPVSHLTVRVHLVDGDAIASGKTFGARDGGVIHISVGRSTTPAHFSRDWMMTHEMVHLGFPSVPESNHWIEEGIATYVEPIARARIGQLRAEQVWADVVRDLPQGLPQVGDRGLDFTPTWGRTYWGGALFCLLADIEIRERSGNTKGLVDALRGILGGGGSISEDWDLPRALRIGDNATGVPVLQELYERMRAAPAPVDLDAIWQKLGIEKRGRTVVLKKTAPLADIRRAILTEN